MGGAVRFADGGGVDDLAMADEPLPAAPASAAPMTDASPGWYINPEAVSASAPVDYNAPPADPTMAQVTDGQGNPSRGLIGAISDGLHWLGDHLGLVGSAQAHPAIAQTPEIQTRRQQLVNNDPEGATYITHQNREELNDLADPNHQLEGSYRNLAGLEAGYKWAMSRGDEETAARLAASILHYDVLTSQNLSAEAAKSLYNGDIRDAVEKTNQAIAAVPDGRFIHVTLNPDGKTVTVTGSDMSGQQLWQKYGSAATILEHATALGRSGKLQWDALESQAAKYDSTFANMVKNRQLNVTEEGRDRRQQEAWQHQQDVLDAKEAAKQKAAEDEANREAEYYRTQNPPPAATPATPAPVTPATTTVAAAPTPAPPTTAPPTTAPEPTTTPTAKAPTADATAPTGAIARGPTGHGGALPGPPASPADMASADATNVNFERMEDDARQKAAATIQARYADEAKSLPSPPRRPDENPNFMSLSANGKANAWKDYNAQLERYNAGRHDLQTRMTTDIANANKDISDRIATQRQTQANQDIQTRQEIAANRAHGWDVEKEQTQQDNRVALVNYNDQVKRAEPRNPTEAREELGATDTRVPLAQAFLPDAAKQGDTLTGDAAGTALVAAGFDPGVQQVLQTALHSGFMNSPLSTKEEVARGVMLFASGRPGAGVLDPRTNVRHVAVSDDKGYVSTFSIPEAVYQNLKILNAKGSYAAKTKQAIATAPPPEARPSTVPASQAPVATPEDIGGPGWYKRTHPAISATP
jgi:hypothetical protein